MSSLPLAITWEVLVLLSSPSLLSLRSTCRAARDEWCSGPGWDLAWWRPRFCRKFLNTMLTLAAGGEDFPCATWKALCDRLSDIRNVRWKECKTETDKERLVQTRTVPYKFVTNEHGSHVMRVGGRYFHRVHRFEIASVSMVPVQRLEDVEGVEVGSIGGGGGREWGGASVGAEGWGGGGGRGGGGGGGGGGGEGEKRYRISLPKWKRIRTFMGSIAYHKPQPLTGFSVTTTPIPGPACRLNMEGLVRVVSQTEGKGWEGYRLDVNRELLWTFGGADTSARSNESNELALAIPVLDTSRAQSPNEIIWCIPETQGEARPRARLGHSAHWIGGSTGRIVFYGGGVKSPMRNLNDMWILDTDVKSGGNAPIVRWTLVAT